MVVRWLICSNRARRLRRGNDYSIPHALVRRRLTVVSETLVRVLDGPAEVARHVTQL